MTDYSGVTWRVNYGELNEREQFRVGLVNMAAFDAYFPVAQLADLVSTLNAVIPLDLNVLARGSSIQAVKVSDGLLPDVVISPRLDTGTPVEYMRLPLSELSDLLYALGLFQVAVSPAPDDWDNTKRKPLPADVIPMQAIADSPELKNTFVESALTARGVALLQHRPLFMEGDSFGVDIGNGEPYTQLLVDVQDGGAHGIGNVSGSFWQDIATRCLGLSPSLPASTLTLNGGINAVVHGAGSAVVLAAERDALATAIWSMFRASVGSLTDWTLNGPGWADYTNGGLLGGNSKSVQGTSPASNYAATTPPAGDYVGFGVTYLSGTFESGDWERGGSDVRASTNVAQGATNIGTNYGLAQRPVPLIGLDGATEVRVSNASSSDYLIVQPLLKLNPTPPRLVVLAPTYVKPGSTYAAQATPERVNTYRQMTHEVVESILNVWAPARGRIAVADPVLDGWDASTMTAADGLHPNEAGSAFLRDRILQALSTLG